MELTLLRAESTDKSTAGVMLIDGAFECYTLEDVERKEKIYGQTAIPPGRYKVTNPFSNRFQKPLPLLHGVPGFTGVRIHSGNTDADTDGCILVGCSRGPDFVGQSRAAMGSLQPKIQAALDRGEEVWLTILSR